MEDGGDGAITEDPAEGAAGSPSVGICTRVLSYIPYLLAQEVYRRTAQLTASRTMRMYATSYKYAAAGVVYRVLDAIAHHPCGIYSLPKHLYNPVIVVVLLPS